MEQKDNTGVLFKNETKTKETQPDYTGNCIIDGKEKRIACWVKTSSTGKKYMSLVFNEKVKNEAPTNNVAPQDDFVNDDIPW